MPGAPLILLKETRNREASVIVLPFYLDTIYQVEYCDDAVELSKCGSAFKTDVIHRM
jgi:hypothetical protein